MIQSTRHQGSQEVCSFEFVVHKNMQIMMFIGDVITYQ